MSDSVKFIFKTLIKVPCIILGAFAVMNLFAFLFIYFKVLGLSYVVMQEVAENNYITTSQFNQINNYMEEINNIIMVENASLIIGVDSAGDPVWCNMDASNSNRMVKQPVTALDESSSKSAFTRTQYGASRVIGVHCNYTIVWPLDYNTANGDTDGVDGNSDNTEYNSVQTTYKQPDNMKKSVVGELLKVTIPIDIYFVIPGLKYYAR